MALAAAAIAVPCQAGSGSGGGLNSSQVSLPCLKMHGIMAIKGAPICAAQCLGEAAPSREKERSDTLTHFKRSSLRSISPGTNFEMNPLRGKRAGQFRCHSNRRTVCAYFLQALTGLRVLPLQFSISVTLLGGGFTSHQKETNLALKMHITDSSLDLQRIFMFFCSQAQSQVSDWYF